GETVDVGTVIATIEAGVGTANENAKPAEAPKSAAELAKPAETKAVKTEPKVEKIVAASAENQLNLSPLARKMMESENISEAELLDFFKHYRLSKKDVQYYQENKSSLPSPKGTEATSFSNPSWGGTRDMDRKKMSMLRKKLSERLVSVKNETAMLTTFNEVNMTPIMEIRSKYKEIFKTKHNVGLGFMSFFTKAVTEALAMFPQVNSQIDGDEIVTFNYADISIAVSGPKGLVVPVIRNAETLSLAQIELEVKKLATKARDNKLTLEEMTGGTFTITNGGVFGSMLSTPIINPPQSAILGMHNIVERPVAVNGKVEIHPIMYIALSYDHRIIDGRESVGFLVKVKEML
ncbi:MAG: dihydrolipoyllysine-residue succinyltransferase, partial [Bacteroidales bacterium]|nr:dihydrolipoyllysine-residue succinyltransferase [Bacteroidales bacterium]